MKKLIGLTIGVLLLVNAWAQEIPDNTPINKIQVIGSHNSYKRAIDPALFNYFMEKDSTRIEALAYNHIPIEDQLKLGLLNLEIDVYRDTKGGRYAHPKGLDMASGQVPYDPNGEMLKPGYKVFHVPDIDFRTDSYTLEALLKKLRKWSMDNPEHYPVFITLETKGGGAPRPGYTATEEVNEQAFAELEEAIAKHLGKEYIIKPDDVRGKYATLNEAIAKGNWPTIKRSRGKYLFVLDDHAVKREIYLKLRPGLKGAILFADADPGKPESAVLIRNNSKIPELKSLVLQGYIIRTRADANTRQARLNDRSNFEAAGNAGAQIITTDYYQKSHYFNSDYRIYFEGGKYIRINPVFNNAASPK